MPKASIKKVGLLKHETLPVEMSFKILGYIKSGFSLLDRFSQRSKLITQAITVVEPDSVHTAFSLEVLHTATLTPFSRA